MKKSLETILVGLLASTLTGCATLHAPSPPKMVKVDYFDVDKRNEDKRIPIQEFIKPEQTIDALEKVEIINYTQDPQENKIRSILNYVQNLPRVKDEEEFWQYPHETLQKGGDCDDKSFLLTSMLTQAGIEAKVAIVEKQASILEKPFYNHINHICVKVKHNNKEYFLETLDKKPVMIPVEKAKDYKVIGEFDKKTIIEYKY